MSNFQGRNLGPLVDFARTSSLSTTQGMGSGRERLRYLTASLFNLMLSEVLFEHNMPTPDLSVTYICLCKASSTNNFQLNYDLNYVHFSGCNLLSFSLL